MKKKMIGSVPGNILGMLADLMHKLQHGVITPEQLNHFLKGQNPSDAYRVTVDYGQLLDAMIAAGRYDGMHGDITDQNFPISGSGTCETEIALFHFDKSMPLDTVLAELDKRGFRAATLTELLALGADQPELQRQFPIVALGSIWHGPRGDRGGAAYLGRIPAGRSLDLLWYEGDWSGLCRFAAVRKFA